MFSEHVKRFKVAKAKSGRTHEAIYDLYVEMGGDKKRESMENWVRGDHEPEAPDDFILMFRVFNRVLKQAKEPAMFPDLVAVGPDDSGSLSVGRGGIEPPTYWFRVPLAA